MPEYYTSFGTLQEELRSYYHRTGKRMQFIEAVDSLSAKGLLSSSPAALSDSARMFGRMDGAEFNRVVDGIAVPVQPSGGLRDRVDEQEMIPLLRDVFIIRHPRYTRPYRHMHNYVEIDYVAEGSCRFHFEGATQALAAGDLCVVAPRSLHDIEIVDESTVYCIMLRRSTFESTFFSLLSHDDVLSLFFRTVLREDAGPNYLRFHAGDMESMRFSVQNAMAECHKADEFSNSCCIAWVNILLACLLRSHSGAPVLHDERMKADFSMILREIQREYRSLTLSELAERFHYSKPHLCTLIRQNTGLSFTALVKRIRMGKAVEYLLSSDAPVGEIAERVGYHSADHFSRVFRGSYGVSPQEYRRRGGKK